MQIKCIQCGKQYEAKRGPQKGKPARCRACQVKDAHANARKKPQSMTLAGGPKLRGVGSRSFSKEALERGAARHAPKTSAASRTVPMFAEPEPFKLTHPTPKAAKPSKTGGKHTTALLVRLTPEEHAAVLKAADAAGVSAAAYVRLRVRGSL